MPPIADIDDSALIAARREAERAQAASRDAERRLCDTDREWLQAHVGAVLPPTRAWTAST